MLNPQDNDFSYQITPPLIFHPFIHLDRYQPGPRPLFFETASADIYINSRKTRTNLSHNSEMMEKISHDILNGGEWDTNSHTHTHTAKVDIIEHVVVFVVGDLVTLPARVRPYCEVIHHGGDRGRTQTAAESGGTRPVIAKRRSITLWYFLCGNRTQKSIRLRMCVYVRRLWKLSYPCHSRCPWGTNNCSHFQTNIHIRGQKFNVCLPIAINQL